MQLRWIHNFKLALPVYVSVNGCLSLTYPGCTCLSPNVSWDWLQLSGINNSNDDYNGCAEVHLTSQLNFSAGLLPVDIMVTCQTVELLSFHKPFSLLFKTSQSYIDYGAGPSLLTHVGPDLMKTAPVSIKVLKLLVSVCILKTRDFQCSVKSDCRAGSHKDRSTHTHVHTHTHTHTHSNLFMILVSDASLCLQTETLFTDQLHSLEEQFACQLNRASSSTPEQLSLNMCLWPFLLLTLSCISY